MYRHALPAELGGSDGSNFDMAVIRQHLANKPLGLHSDLQTESSCVGNFPIVLVLHALGSAGQRELIEPMLRHEVVGAFGLTEPGHGSDATWLVGDRAQREGGDTPGFEVLYHQWTFNMPSDHSEVALRDVRIPDSAIVGEEGKGLAAAMLFVHENRIRQAASSLGAAQFCVDRSVSYALGTAALLVVYVPGEALPQRIVREERFAAARAGLARECGTLLGRLHAIPADAAPGLNATDPIDRCRGVLDHLGAAHPAFELVLRRLELTRPAARPVGIVHGDFRLGNLLITEPGIAAVLDWELVHLGDPLEDLGYLCVRAWRFGGRLPVAGVGTYEDLLDSYRSAGGSDVSLEELLWWQAATTVWWGVLCLVQASRHLSGETRSVELAAIGRRACEQEWDALALLKDLR